MCGQEQYDISKLDTDTTNKLTLEIVRSTIKGRDQETTRMMNRVLVKIFAYDALLCRWPTVALYRYR